MRARQLAAAEKRAAESAGRGIGNQAKVQQWEKQQQIQEQHEKNAQMKGGDTALRVRILDTSFSTALDRIGMSSFFIMKYLWY